MRAQTLNVTRAKCINMSLLSSGLLRVGMNSTLNIAEAANPKARRLTWTLDCGFRKKV